MFKLKINNEYDVIILSTCLFGSVYLFSTSLIGLNKKFLKNEATISKNSTELLLNESNMFFELFNGTILVLSGTIMTITTYKAFQILNKF